MIAPVIQTAANITVAATVAGAVTQGVTNVSGAVIGGFQVPVKEAELNAQIPGLVTPPPVHG
jgi:hypothetical protein